jgi:thiamine pyrophosphate-dependent acetolactate synthase large subunit-like protein
MFEQVDDWLEPLAQFSKWRWHIKYPQRVGEMVRRAVKVSGTPPGGPVYIRIPINVLAATKVKDRIYPKGRFNIPMEMTPKPELIEKAAKLLIEAKRPWIRACRASRHPCLSRDKLLRGLSLQAPPLCKLLGNGASHDGGGS